jgi:molecular chaperone DnaJ
MVDYYSILEIDRNASKDDIVKAYRNLAKRYHPDRNIGNKEAEEKFKKIQEAYEILSDEDKKSQHDNPNPFINIDFDIFNQSAIQKGNDIFLEVFISLREGCFGTIKEIIFNRGKICQDCQGVGFENLINCDKCQGKGKVTKVFQQPFQFELLCPSCQGKGKIYKNICKVCSGKKTNGSDMRKVNLKIPSGIGEENNLVIDQEGECCSSGVNGSLIIAVRFDKNSGFQKVDHDLICEKVIPYTTFVLGGTLEVQTIDDEKIEIKIPAGTQIGTNLRIKNKGYCYLNNKEKRGDLIAKLSIEIPRNLEDNKIFEELKKVGF